MNQFKEITGGQIVDTLTRYSYGIDQRFDLFASYLVEAIELRVWEAGWMDELSGVQYAESFKQFVELEPPKGIGYSLTKMYAILKGPSGIDKDARAALDLMIAECHREGIDVAAQCAVGERQELPVSPKPGAPEGNSNAAKEKNKGDNVTFDSNPRGNAATHTLKRLKRDNPELAERVVNGDLSANAAAIEAGFRKPTITLQSSNPVRAAETIHAKFGPEFAHALKEAL
jgi:hypothetical protein